MRVASKAGKLPFKFGHSRPLGSLIIRYVSQSVSHHVRDGRTDRQTDGQKQRLFPLSYRRGIITHLLELEPVTD